MTDSQRAGDGATELRPLQIETNGINVITEAERKGHPRDLFWPWFAANVSVLGTQLRLVRAGVRHLVLAGDRGRGGRDRDLVPAMRVHRGGRQTGIRLDDGARPGRVRGAGQ